ncbi:porin family protein [Acidobacteriota bacterium]
MNNMSNKKLPLVLVLFLHFLIILSFRVYAQETKRLIVIKKENTILRLYPREDSLAIKELPLGALLEVEEEIGEWFKIELPLDKDGIVITGYVHQSAVSIIKKGEEISEKITKEKPKVSSQQKLEVTDERVERKQPRFGLGFESGYSSFTDNNYKGGLKYGGSIVIIVTRNIAFELSGINSQSDVKGNPSGLSDGRISLTSISLSIQGRFPLGNNFVPYIVGGGSYWTNKFTLDSNTISSWKNLGFEIIEEIENSTGFHFGAGMDIFITRKIAITGDVRYSKINTNGTWEILEQVTNLEVSNRLENLDFSSVMIGLGLKFYF